MALTPNFDWLCTRSETGSSDPNSSQFLMVHSRVGFAVALLALVGLLLAAGPASACICPLLDPKSEFKRVDSVFLGKVIEYDGKWATFEVIRKFKGRDAGQIRVRTVPHGETCGYGWALATDSEHLVYAVIDDSGDLRTSTCTRTWKGSSSECDLRLLERRAAWWRSRLSSLRILKWLGVHWASCYPRLYSGGAN